MRAGASRSHVKELMLECEKSYGNIRNKKKSYPHTANGCKPSSAAVFAGRDLHLVKMSKFRKGNKLNQTHTKQLRVFVW